MPTEQHPPEVCRSEQNWRSHASFVRLWVALCAVLWFAVGILWGRVELAGIFLFGVPVWACFIATFYRFQLSPNATFGVRSIVGVSLTSSALWAAMCTCSASNPLVSERGQTSFESTVVLLVIWLGLILIPLTAWLLSSDSPSENVG